MQIESNLGDFQYLFIDLILALALAFGSEQHRLVCPPLPLPLTSSSSPAVGYSGPAQSLVRKRPPCTLVGPLVISQLLVHIALIVAFQLAIWFYLHTTLW